MNYMGDTDDVPDGPEAIRRMVRGDKAVSDIVERLREAHPRSPQLANGSMILSEAADEIDRLREKNTELNRRCQTAESVANSCIRQIKKRPWETGESYPASFRTMLYAAGLSKAEREIERMRSELDAVETLAKSIRAESKNVLSSEFDISSDEREFGRINAAEKVLELLSKSGS